MIVPHDRQYEEGDAILRSELDPLILEALEQDQRPARVEVAGEPIPDEYYAIEDPYERHKFIKKVMFSKQLKISMAELEAKIAKGEIDVSLSAREKESVDTNEARKERRRILKSFAKPVPSDKPPVKVRLLADTAQDALPGWIRKMECNSQLGNDEIGSGAAHSATDRVDERAGHDDVRGAPVRSDLPHFPADLSRVVEPVPQDIADLQKRLTPEGVEAKLEQSVSPHRFDETQRLIKQYGTEEGVRRFREVDPEAAQQFQRERLRSGSPQPSEPSRDVLDGEESEQ